MPPLRPMAGGGGGGPPVPFAGGEGLFFHLRQYQGLNTRTVRTDIKDEQFSWLENLIPIDEGNMRALYSNGATLYTAPGGKSIIYFKMFNIGAVQYAAVFLSDGTADQVDMSGTVVHISTVANTFYQGGTFYAAGAASPTWLNNGVATTMPSGIKGTYVETFQSRAWVADGSVEHFSAPGNGASFSGATGGGSFTAVDSFLRVHYVANKQSNGFLYIFGDSSINVIDNVQTSGTPLATTFTNRNVDPQIGSPWPATVQVFVGGRIVFANPRSEEHTSE